MDNNEMDNFGKRDPMKQPLLDMIGSDETILYEGKPHKKCLWYRAIFQNVITPFVLAWLGMCILAFVCLACDKDANSNISVVIIVVIFMLIFMIPVWLYLANIFLSGRRYRVSNYIITDKAVYASNNAHKTKFERLPLTDISTVDIFVGNINSKFNVGDVIITDKGVSTKKQIIFFCISEYQKVFDMIYDLKS